MAQSNTKIDPRLVKWEAEQTEPGKIDLRMVKWQDAKPAEKYDPTEGMSTTEKLLAGAGKSVADTGRGLGQLLRSGIEYVAPPQKSLSDLVTGGQGKSFADTLGLPTQSDIDEAARLDKPLMDTGAGLTGNIAGQVAQMAIPGAMVGKLAPAARLATLAPKAAPYLGAATEAGLFTAAQPVLTGESRLKNTAISAGLGAGGQGVANVIGGVTKFAQNLAPEVKALYDKATAAGIPVNVAQLGDSKFLKTLQSTLERLPYTGAQGARNAQQEAFNRAVSRTFGEDAPKVTRDVYASAKGRIGSEFERLSAQNSLAVDNNLLGQLAGTVDEANKFATGDTARAVQNAVDELLSKADAYGAVPGKAYQALDSKLGKLTKSGDEKAMYLGQVRETVRNAMDASISAADKEAWQTARRQYKNLKTVRDLVAKEGAEGNISPSLLMGRINTSQAGKEAMAMGKGGELGDLALIGRQFVRDPIPDSGTPGRLAALGALGGGGYALGIDPQTMLWTLGGGATIGRVANRAINSKALAEGNALLRALDKGTIVSPALLPALANARQKE